MPFCDPFSIRYVQLSYVHILLFKCMCYEVGKLYNIYFLFEILKNYTKCHMKISLGNGLKHVLVYGLVVFLNNHHTNHTNNHHHKPQYAWESIWFVSRLVPLKIQTFLFLVFIVSCFIFNFDLYIDYRILYKITKHF